MRTREQFVRAATGLLLTLVAAVSLIGSQPFDVIQGPDVESFMASATIVRSLRTLNGVAAPKQVILDLDGVTRFGVFKTIDDKRAGLTQLSGGADMNFQDSWRTEIAAYELDKLIGLGMVPVTVERVFQGTRGSLQAWAPVAMSENDRVKNQVRVPNVSDWNDQMHKVRIFDNLIYNTDRHLNNIVITEDWKVVLIDHSRSFRPFGELRTEDDLTRFSRSLLESIGRLTKESLDAHLREYLDSFQIDGILKRRDRLVARAERLASEQGPDAVWFP